MNQFNFCGRLTRDPDTRQTKSGISVCNFGLALNRKTKDGEDTTFVDMEAWERQADVLSQYAKKGSQILVTGRVKQDSWENEHGDKRTKHIFVVERFDFIGNKPESDQSSEVEPVTKTDVPF